MQTSFTLEELYPPEELRAQLCLDVQNGLTATLKQLPPMWFYDEKGSRLFEEITRLPEYYLARAELEILRREAGAIASITKADTLVEIGSGTSEKTRLLLDAMTAAGSLRKVVLFDISKDVLCDAAQTIRQDYGVSVHAIVGDFRHQLSNVPLGGRRLWAFLGSTIGNFPPGERSKLLFDFDACMTGDDHLLIGTDLQKAMERLVAAYDDAAGVTAAFNKNMLEVINRELHADFALNAYRHRARWNPSDRWMEMRLRATRRQSVRVADLDLLIELCEGEEILTETSAKFTPDQVKDELFSVGMTQQMAWFDAAGDFQLTLAVPYC